MGNGFNILEFAGLSEDRPWELTQPQPTDLRAVVSTKDCPTLEGVGKAIASFVGEAIDTEKIEPPESDVSWAMRARIGDIPADVLLWAEPLTISPPDAIDLETGWVLALQTVLHSGDPLTHFSNLMRVLAGSDLDVHSICDLEREDGSQDQFLKVYSCRMNWNHPKKFFGLPGCWNLQAMPNRKNDGHGCQPMGLLAADGLNWKC